MHFTVKYREVRYIWQSTFLPKSLIHLPTLLPTFSSLLCFPTLRPDCYSLLCSPTAIPYFASHLLFPTLLPDFFSLLCFPPSFPYFARFYKLFIRYTGPQKSVEIWHLRDLNPPSSGLQPSFLTTTPLWHDDVWSFFKVDIFLMNIPVLNGRYRPNKMSKRNRGAK